MWRPPTSFYEQNRCNSILRQYDPHILDIYKAEMARGIERFFFLSFCLACCWPGSVSKSSKLRLIRYWNELEFSLPSEHEVQEAIDRRFYVPGNSVPIDVDVQHRDNAPSRIFVTIPRFDEGRPVTLGTVDESGRILPYPNYTWHDDQGRNCAGFTSVFRVAIDMCNRLWVIDAGKIGDFQYCDPQLVAFDLNTDTVIYRHVLEKRSYNPNSLLITPVVDVRPQGNDCSDTFVYIADVSGFGVVVVDVAHDSSWRVSHKFFFPYPNRGTFTIDGESFDLMDGVLGMALSPIKAHTAERHLFFHALASTTENVMRTSTLRNISQTPGGAVPAGGVHVYPNERPSQSAASAIDRNGIMYFGLMEPPSIWCWNTEAAFTPANFHLVVEDREALQFASGVKIIKNLKGEEELWVLTSSFQRVMTGSLNSMKVNFRIHAEKTEYLGFPCLNSPKEKDSLVYKFADDNQIFSKYGIQSYL